MEKIARDKILCHLTRGNLPVTADVFITDFCNLKCPYCTYGRWDLNHKGKGYMSFDVFVKVVDRLVELGVEGIIITGGGEPTLNPDFDKIADWLSSHDIHWGINTNFTHCKFIHPDFIKISLDGWDEESYKLKKGVNSYQNVIENIKEYIKYKYDHNLDTSVGIQIVTDSVAEAILFYDSVKDLNVDYIQFRPEEGTLKARGKNYELDNFLKEKAEEDPRVLRSFKYDLLNKSFKKCNTQWCQIAVDEKSNVMYCCHKPYEIVGSVFDDDILEKKRKFETDMNKCDIPCRLCGANDAIEKYERLEKTRFI